MSIINKLLFSFQFTGVFVSAFFLASCSTIAPPVTDTTASKVAATESSAGSDAELSVMRDECKAMHEEMKAKMKEGGKMSEDGHMAMPAEMKKKHQKCMETMPELKGKMQAHCKEMTKEAASDGMHKRCKMMADEVPVGGDAGEEK